MVNNNSNYLQRNIAIARQYEVQEKVTSQVMARPGRLLVKQGAELVRREEEDQMESVRREEEDQMELVRREEEDQMESVREEAEEAREVRAPPILATPAREEVRQHRLNHFPFRSW